MSFYAQCPSSSSHSWALLYFSSTLSDALSGSLLLKVYASSLMRRLWVPKPPKGAEGLENLALLKPRKRFGIRPLLWRRRGGSGWDAAWKCGCGLQRESEAIRCCCWTTLYHLAETRPLVVKGDTLWLFFRLSVVVRRSILKARQKVTRVSLRSGNLKKSKMLGCSRKREIYQ